MWLGPAVAGRVHACLAGIGTRARPIPGRQVVRGGCGFGQPLVGQVGVSFRDANGVVPQELLTS